MKYKYHLTLRVNEDVYAKLQADCRKTNEKHATVIRRILEEYYENKGKNNRSQTDR